MRPPEEGKREVCLLGETGKRKGKRAGGERFAIEPEGWIGEGAAGFPLKIKHLF